MPEPDRASPSFHEDAFDARIAALGLTLSPAERANAVAVAMYLSEAASRVRAWAETMPDPTK